MFCLENIEKRLEKPAMQQKITRSARKLLPQVRKDELAKKRSRGDKKWSRILVNT